MKPAQHPVDDLAALVYELLDAHDDTARLAAALPVDERWAAHLGYLQDLQRLGREALAQASPDSVKKRRRWSRGLLDTISIR
jgi:hypothetical protein